MSKRLLTIYFVLFASAITASVANAQSQALIDRFEERTFRYTGGKYKDAEIKYRLHVPENRRHGKKYPLIVHLHGIGEAGTDNRHSLLYLDSILPLMTGPGSLPFFLLVLQCPPETPGWAFNRSTKDGTLDVLVAAIEHVIAENPVDKQRITATGVSSGGWGTWALALEHPDLLAGIVPTACGAPSQLSKMAALRQTPVWAIINKGDIDPSSLQMAKHIINRSGGSMAITEAVASGHNAWTPAMEQYKCFRWMLAQKRGSWFSPPPGTILNKPHPLLLALFMYVIPFSIVLFLTWGMLCESTATAFQSVRQWISND